MIPYRLHNPFPHVSVSGPALLLLWAWASMLLMLPGCVTRSQLAGGAFLERIEVGVLSAERSGPTQPRLMFADHEDFSAHPLSGGQLSVELLVNVPDKILPDAKVELALFPMSDTKPVRRAELTQLHAGDLKMTLSLAGLSAGQYHLRARLFAEKEKGPAETEVPLKIE